jgi:flagellar basal body-associated protein FliL
MDSYTKNVSQENLKQTGREKKKDITKKNKKMFPIWLLIVLSVSILIGSGFLIYSLTYKNKETVQKQQFGFKFY